MDLLKVLPGTPKKFMSTDFSRILVNRPKCLVWFLRWGWIRMITYAYLHKERSAVHTFSTTIFLCACESLTLTAELQKRTQAREIWCYRNILRISYKDQVTNEEVHAKIQQAIGPHEDLLTIVKRRKL